jgi:Adenosine deaminase
LKLGEQNSPNTKARLVVSLHRDGNYREQYKWIKDLLTENDLVRQYLVGIDFCYIEEGFPPKEKKSFFEAVIQDNHNNPQTALSILYHVGESFADKTPKSAVRWIGESALNGAHRLGHCIALGINPESFANQTISETIGERLDQINFEIFHYEKIKSFGKIKDYSKLIQERDQLANKDFDSKISFAIDKNYIDELNAFQDFVIYLVRDESESVIECCPTSNLYIGMLPNMGEHPIHRFLKNKLRITIGSDDPGIFETSLSQEYSLVANAGIPPKVLENIQKSSVSFISEKLSGRKA